MRVLFDHPFPFSLTHGGLQTQIEQTKLALEGVGVEVEHMRWWDDRQRGDIIHYFGRPVVSYVAAAHSKGMKVVIAELLSETATRSRNALRAQKLAMVVARKLLPSNFTLKLAWDAYTAADAVIANTPGEARLMRYLFGASAECVHVVGNSVESVFFDAPAVPRGKWLVCTATITERKRVVELAEAAIAEAIPVWIIGKPYSEADPYARRFAALVNKSKGAIRYEGPIQDRCRLAAIYRQARGFVLLSSMETLSFSALEAAACECPLLLSDLEWARSAFGDGAQYCPVDGIGKTSMYLRKFYEAAPSLRSPHRPPTWLQIAQQFKEVYNRVLSTSR